MSKEVIEGPLGQSLTFDHELHSVTAKNVQGIEFTVYADDNGVIPEDEVNALFLFAGLGPLHDGEYEHGLTGGKYH